MTITAHCLVRNEGRFVWYAVMSVIGHVDKVLLWDTGSTDGTIEILKEIKKIGGKKVDFIEVGEVDTYKFTKIRQEMLDTTTTDWFTIVDGDEVWWEDSIKLVVDNIQSSGSNLESIVSPYYNIAGDIYHYRGESTGRYKIDDKKGYINIRAINRNVPGLHFAKPHGLQGVFDKDSVLIQHRPKERRIFINAPYLHFTNVQRSSSPLGDEDVPKRFQKLKYDLGIPFPSDFYYPEVFFRPRPKIVPSPWVKRSLDFRAKALLLSPARVIKNLVLPERVGY